MATGSRIRLVTSEWLDSCMGAAEMRGGLASIGGRDDLGEAVDRAFDGHLDEVVFRLPVAEEAPGMVSLGVNSPCRAFSG